MTDCQTSQTFCQGSFHRYRFLLWVPLYDRYSVFARYSLLVFRPRLAVIEVGQEPSPSTSLTRDSSVALVECADYANIKRADSNPWDRAFPLSPFSPVDSRLLSQDSSQAPPTETLRVWGETVEPGDGQSAVWSLRHRVFSSRHRLKIQFTGIRTLTRL